MDKYNILIIEGDGIGPEVIACATEVLSKVLEQNGHKYNLEYGLMGHAAIQKTGLPLPVDTLEKAKKADAILFGAIGHPSYDNNPKATVRPEQGLLAIRKELNLFANIRPIQIFPALIAASPIKPERLQNTDILFFRELTGGIYFGAPRGRDNRQIQRQNEFANGQTSDFETAFDTCVYSSFEIERIAKMAFESAKNRKKKLTSVDKSNVLETSRLWKEVVNKVANSYPEVQLEHQLVDSMAMKLISNPAYYDVVLTENLFGDILTDEASQISGSMGLLASASVGFNSSNQNKIFGLYEPIHGSAPDISGQNIANPLASILSAALLLEMSLGLKQEADLVKKAVSKILQDGFRTKDTASQNDDPNKILGTKETGQKVLQALDKM